MNIDYINYCKLSHGLEGFIIESDEEFIFALRGYEKDYVRPFVKEEIECVLHYYEEKRK